VLTPETIASNGAGSIIHMPENLDPGLKPYLLEYNGASVDSIYRSIDHAVDMIDKLANTGGVRATGNRSMSGLALQTEFQLMNAKLAEKADHLELCEEQLWELFALYQNSTWTGSIQYPDSFSIQDEESEYAKLQVARSAATSPEALTLIDHKLMELVQNNLSAETVDLPAPATLTTDGEISAPAGAETGANCPLATQDIAVNLANRARAIRVANYGPLNPALPNRTFWMAKANIFKTTVAEAKTSRCGNCAAFNQTARIGDCIDAGLAAGGSGAPDAWATIAAGDLGYCEAFDFKCASSRTCDSWIVGGPIKD
jgi:hypothetical protein